MVANTLESDADLRQLIEASRSVAVVGMKSEPAEDAYRVPLYLQRHGHRILPVNPKLDLILGERAFHSLQEIGVAVDLVNLFRAPDHIPGHVEQILDMRPRPRAVWMQLGIVHGAAAARLRAEGLQVVQDRCIMVEHRRLLSER